MTPAAAAPSDFRAQVEPVSAKGEPSCLRATEFSCTGSAHLPLGHAKGGELLGHMPHAVLTLVSLRLPSRLRERPVSSQSSAAAGRETEGRQASTGADIGAHLLMLPKYLNGPSGDGET